MNVDGTGMLRLFLTKMFVTMTPNPWQQTENYITWKFGENVVTGDRFGPSDVTNK